MWFVGELLNWVLTWVDGCARRRVMDVSEGPRGSRTHPTTMRPQNDSQVGAAMDITRVSGVIIMIIREKRMLP